MKYTLAFLLLAGSALGQTGPQTPPASNTVNVGLAPTTITCDTSQRLVFTYATVGSIVGPTLTACPAVVSHYLALASDGTGTATATVGIPAPNTLLDVQVVIPSALPSQTGDQVLAYCFDGSSKGFFLQYNTTDQKIKFGTNYSTAGFWAVSSPATSASSGTMRVTLAPGAAGAALVHFYADPAGGTSWTDLGTQNATQAVVAGTACAANFKVGNQYATTNPAGVKIRRASVTEDGTSLAAVDFGSTASGSPTSVAGTAGGPFTLSGVTIGP